MATGLAATTLANKWLDMFSGAVFTAPTCYVQLHTGDPGAAGTANVSSTILRKQLTWSSAAAGSKSIAATLPSWTSWAGTNGEVVTHIAVFDQLAAGGNFLFSCALSASKTVNTADTLNLTALTFAFSPIAA